MWKDFFYFSKSLRTGIVVLIVLIVIAISVNYSLKYYFPVKEMDGKSFLTEVEAFKKSLVSPSLPHDCIVWHYYNSHYPVYFTSNRLYCSTI
jgi:hypothetical protein